MAIPLIVRGVNKHNMLVALLLNILVLIVGVIFSWVPDVTTLPVIAGFDLDSALVTGMGYTRTFMVTFWPLAIMFQGFLILMFYYVAKFTLKFFLGSRNPG